MKLGLDYGTDGLAVEVPGERATVIEPVFLPPAPNPGNVLRQALRSPAGKPPLRDLVRPGQKIGISVCDITRAQPRQLMLEALFSEIPDLRMEDVTVFIATGTHRRNSNEEIGRMLGREIAQRIGPHVFAVHDQVGLLPVDHRRPEPVELGPQRPELIDKLLQVVVGVGLDDQPR